MFLVIFLFAENFSQVYNVLTLAPQPSSPSQVNHFFITVHRVQSMLTLCESMLGHLQECGPPTNEDFPEKNFLLPKFSVPKAPPLHMLGKKNIALFNCFIRTSET